MQLCITRIIFTDHTRCGIHVGYAFTRCIGNVAIYYGTILNGDAQFFCIVKDAHILQIGIFNGIGTIGKLECAVLVIAPFYFVHLSLIHIYLDEQPYFEAVKMNAFFYTILKNLLVLNLKKSNY